LREKRVDPISAEKKTEANYSGNTKTLVKIPIKGKKKEGIGEGERVLR